MNEGTETNKIATPAALDSTVNNAFHNKPITTIVDTNNLEINESNYSFCNCFIYLKLQHVTNVTILQGTVSNAGCSDVAILSNINIDKHNKENSVRKPTEFILIFSFEKFLHKYACLFDIIILQISLWFLCVFTFWCFHWNSGH